MRRVLERCADIQYVSLNCGPDQVEFYEKLGFSFTSDFFEEVGVPHKAMVKHLAATI